MSQSSAQNDSMIGLAVDGGRYTIVKLIGEGGMGRVFQARQTSMNRMVALKILRRQLAGDSHLLDRFEREAMSVSRLRHPNTITIYDYGKTEDGFLFMAMELLGGRSLYSMLRDDGALPLPRALHIFEQVCGAVQEAHTLGIVHRDLKPENIQIDQVANDPDYAKVLDFGIAKIVHGDQDLTGEQKTLTLAGAVFGTPHYMSPEQVHGLKIDHRTDIYSLGVILFEMLSGRTPFDGATPMAVMMAQANKPPPALREVNPDADATESVIALINDCMAKDREARPADMQAVLQRVQQIQYELGEVSSVRLPAAALGINASGGMAVGDRATPLPQVAGASDAGPTPEFSGAVGTLAPGSLGTDEFAPPRRTGVWIALVAVLLVGGGIAAWQMTQAPDPAPAGTSQAPARVTVVPDKTKSYQITSTPKAFVHLAGESQGLTPMELRLDPSKAWRVELHADGYQPATIDFDADLPDDGRVRHVKLEKIPDTPRDWLTLVSDPPGAEIYRGANYLGTTPFEWKPEVEQQPVELKFSLEGHTDHAASLKLQAAGEAAREYKVTLEKPKPAVAPPKPMPKPKPIVRRRRRPVTQPASKAPARPASQAPASKAPAKAPTSKAPATQAPRYEKL